MTFYFATFSHVHLFPFSYKQQHQTFVQHINQQVTLLDTQKLALEQQQQQHNLLNTKKIPPLLPPASEDLLNNVQLNGNNIQNQQGTNFISNDRNKKPPPLMSQNIQMPNMSSGPTSIRQLFDTNDNSFGVSQQVNINCI